MAKRHTHEDDVVEVELKRGGAKVRTALKGLDAKKQKQVLDAIEACVTEGIEQALAWADEHVAESDALVVTAADHILRAAAESGDEPALVGRVYGTLCLLGLDPDAKAAVKARRSRAGTKAASALADHLAAVERMFAEEEARLSKKK